MLLIDLILMHTSSSSEWTFMLLSAIYERTLADDVTDVRLSRMNSKIPSCHCCQLSVLPVLPVNQSAARWWRTRGCFSRTLSNNWQDVWPLSSPRRGKK